MSKFIKGDIVDAQWLGGTTTRGMVHESWGSHISRRTGLPMTEIFLFDQGFVGSFDEDEVELALDEYEFMAVYVDQEDFDQAAIGVDEWGTLEYAESMIQRAKEQEEDPEWKEAKQLQINRRRKAGHTVGHEAFRWDIQGR